MIDCGAFHFACPWYTGSDWFIRACRVAGIPVSNKARDVHRPFGDRLPGVLRVSLVMNPCDWLASRHHSTVHLFGDIPSVSFRQSILLYLNQVPGAVGQMFAKYDADVVLRVEDLPFSFFDLMRAVGLDPASPSRTSVSIRRPKRHDYRYTWDKRLRSLVANAERNCMEKYDYV